MAPVDHIRVMVTLKPPPGITYLDKTGNHTQEKLKKSSLVAAAAKPRLDLSTILAGYDIQDRAEVSDFSAIVRVSTQTH
jgi:hypothetical protein